MAQAHSKGVSTALVAIIIGATLAVGLKINFLMWGAILLSPIVFQGTASKAWRHLKPQVMLEYLAARAAARRFAFTLNSNKLTIASVVRGQIEPVLEHENQQEALEEQFENNHKKDVWITLFHDALVVISEQAGGAKLELGQLLNKNIEVSGESPSGQGEYANDREIHVKVSTPFGHSQRWKLTSRYPAAIVVFEKQMAQLIGDARSENLIPEATEPDSESVVDDFLNLSFGE